VAKHLNNIQFLIPEKKQAGYQYRNPVHPLGCPYPEGVYKRHFKHYLKKNNVNNNGNHLYAQRNVYIAQAYYTIKYDVGKRHKYKHYKYYRQYLGGHGYQSGILFAGKHTNTKLRKQINNQARQYRKTHAYYTYTPDGAFNPAIIALAYQVTDNCIGR